MIPFHSEAAGAPPLSRETPSAEVSALVEHLAEEMTRRWRKGERPLVEEYLGLHPQLPNSPEDVLELIAEELHLRDEYGLPATPAELTERFPHFRAQVLALASCHSLLAGHLAAPRFPNPGDTLGDFRLDVELGRGAHGRVFRATQPALADRAVVLKLAPSAGLEHLSLARLQHTHIVPLYSVHDFPERGLRGLCLPYFGGATLGQTLEALRPRPPSARSGSDLLNAPAGAAVEVSGPAGRFLARASYAQAVCWLGACLADALQYAHERGVLHLDLKPSNVLLAADGQPMLLDFHLARPPLAAGEAAPAWLGGTPGHMAPEHEAALAAVRTRGTLTAGVDGRADLYSLGVLLYEALSGALPGKTDAAATALRRSNPLVSAGVAEMVAKCLASDPRQRYQSAAALAADLRRQLANLPLRQVPNTAAERWQKWRRRRPHVPIVAGAIIALAAAACIVAAHMGVQARQAEAALRDGKDELRQGQYAHAEETLRHGSNLAESLPFRAALTRELREHLEDAQRGQAADELHLFAETIRPLYAAQLLPAAQARAVDAHCRRFWENRQLIVQRLGSDPHVRPDLLDLAILFADLHVRASERGQEAAAQQAALQILAEAEADFGPSCVLYQERRKYATALGLSAVAEEAAAQAAARAPQSAWEHYALGRALFAQGEVAKAAAEMERALQLQPQGLWPNFYKGACDYRRARFADAVTAFSVCVVLAPESAWCAYNRGLAYQALGRNEEARRDFDRALALDGTLAGAALGRAILDYRAGQYDLSLAALNHVANEGLDQPDVYYTMALVQRARHDDAAARHSLERALAVDPHHRPSLELRQRLGAAH